MFTDDMKEMALIQDEALDPRVASKRHLHLRKKTKQKKAS